MLLVLSRHLLQRSLAHCVDWEFEDVNELLLILKSISQMIRSLAHCGGNFRKTATLLSKYVIKFFGEYGTRSKGLTMENSLEDNCTPEDHMFHLDRYSRTLLCAADTFCVKVPMN